MTETERTDQPAAADEAEMQEAVTPQTETTQAEAAQTETTQAEAAQTETTQAEAAQTETTQAEAAQTETTQGETAQTEGAIEAAAPAPDPVLILEQVSAQSPTEGEAALTSLVAERGIDALPALAMVAQKGMLTLSVQAMKLLVSLRTQDAATALAAIGADRSDAQRAKEARRALHLLSLAGIKPGVVAPVARPEPEPDKVYACLASAIDGDGTRSITVVRQNRFSTLRMGIFLINEKVGMVDVMGADPCSMTLWKRYLADSNAEEAKAVPVELAFCQQQIGTAVARSQRSKTPLPERYYMFSPLATGPSELRDRPAELRPETIQANPDLLAKSADLFHLPECHDWLLGTDDVRPYALKMIAEERRQDKIEKERLDKLEVMDLSQLQREGTVISVALSELFDGARRSLFQERLDYTADILWRSDRLEQAQWAMAAALALSSETTLPADQHPFLREVVTHSLDVAIKAEEAAGPRQLGAGPSPETTPDEYVDEQGLIRRKSGLILPK